MFFFEPLQTYQPQRHCVVHQRPSHYPDYQQLLLKALADITDESDAHYNENGDFQWKCQISGFKPEELNVDLDGGELIVTGEHKEQKDEESVERTFRRRIRLPKELDAEKIKCELDGEMLHFNVPRKQPVQAPKQKIPIDIKSDNKQ